MRPAQDALRFGMTCPFDIAVPPQGPGGVHSVVFEDSHRSERVGQTGTYRLKGWTSVPGAVWAAELRFQRSHAAGGGWSWTEDTRLFLRHAPVAR